MYIIFKLFSCCDSLITTHRQYKTIETLFEVSKKCFSQKLDSKVFFLSFKNIYSECET